MASRIGLGDLPPSYQKQAAEQLRTAIPSVRQHPWKTPLNSAGPAAQGQNKYRAQAVLLDGIRFPSKIEAKRYEWLKYMRDSGELFGGKRLVRFGLHTKHPLGGGVVAELDSVQEWVDEKGRTSVVWEDVKGRDNAQSKLKRKLLAALNVFVSLWPSKAK